MNSFSAAVGIFLEDSENEDENGNIINLGQERRFLRQRYHVLEMSNKKFLQSFRVTKQIFKYILREISPFMDNTTTRRSTRIPNEVKLAAVLNFYATGSYQRTIGDVMLHSMDQSMISRSTCMLTEILEKALCAKWIKFPNNEEKLENKQRFYEKTRIPGVIGCIDCTHVDMVAPIENEHIFIHRRGNHSLNVQLLCNYDLKILGVNAKYPGSSHDAGIWSLSSERRKMEPDYHNGERNTWLLGDSGYPVERWLMTPFKTPTFEEHHIFNKIHAKGRNPIERCNGVLKGTFRCLLGERKLRYQPQKVIKIMNVCCALLNICLFHNIELVEEKNNDMQNPPHNYIDDYDSDEEYDGGAISIRNNLMHSLF